ncbi:MAG: hypothetical protein WBN42_09940 [Ignavibacteriaceae bacterium]
MPRKPEKIKMPKGGMSAPGRKAMTIRRKGKKRLVVTSIADIAGNTLTVTFDYNHRNAPSEMLDLFEVQFEEAKQDLIEDGIENVTAAEAIAFISAGLTRYIETTSANLADVITEEE